MCNMNCIVQHQVAPISRGISPQPNKFIMWGGVFISWRRGLQTLTLIKCISDRCPEKLRYWNTIRISGENNKTRRCGNIEERTRTCRYRRQGAFDIGKARAIWTLSQYKSIPVDYAICRDVDIWRIQGKSSRHEATRHLPRQRIWQQKV